MQTLILGTVGSGKSTEAVKRLHLNQKKRIIIDPIGEHTGDHISDSLFDFIQYLSDNPNLDNCTLVLRLIEDEESYSEEMFEILSGAKGWTIFIDEVDQFCDPHRFSKEFKRLVNYRRHWDIDLIMVARRAASVHRDLTAHSSSLVLFKCHEPRDLKFISEFCGPIVSELVTTLEQYEFIEHPMNIY